MLKRKDIPIEDSIRKACEINGLIYDTNGTPLDYITVIDDDGTKITVDRDMNVISKESNQ